jgi:Tol biopolymer transport system component
MSLPERITVEEFFSPPTKAAATISPDGTRIAYLAPWKNRLNIWVQDVDEGRRGRQRALCDGRRDPKRAALRVDA